MSMASRHLQWLLPTRKSYRLLKTDIDYLRYRRQQRRDGKSCVFCQYLGDKQQSVVEDRGDWLVVKNDFPYRKWDWRTVSDHLMIIPKRHLTQLKEIYEKDWSTFGGIVADYDTKGYSIYLRSQANPLKTQPHLHWHLIKVD